MLKIFFNKRYDTDGPGESNCLSIWALVALVSFTVVGVIYAAYLLVGATGITNVAGVHITKNLILAAKSAQGKLYTNQEKGIKDWIIYKDENLGCSIKYPNDLLLARTSDDELEFKKNGENLNSKQRSLLYAFVIRKKSIASSQSGQDFIKNKYPEWDGKFETGLYGGKEGWRTGVFKSVNGIYKEVVFWKLEEKAVYVESRYYLENNGEYVEMFKKMISEITFY
ncbi:MAG: hypothetical protein US70_C0011G0033 [Parcubacteria group bacterium GW2011_GWD2_38_11]|nr:MAG: hypothetical protein US70_C0011G0033 [Parcubacteria group bacterium GW2011_GWD2_38_11]